MQTRLERLADVLAAANLSSSYKYGTENGVRGEKESGSSHERETEAYLFLESVEM